MSENLKLATTILITVLATAGGFFAGKLTNQPEQIVVEHSTGDCAAFNEERGGGYTYINPLLECDNYQPSQLNSVVNMEKKVTGYIEQAKAEQKADYVAVYYRDLNFGPWMGVNEKELFTPASLLKVPVMIGVFKMAQSDPELLKRKIKYVERAEREVDANMLPENALKTGTTYTIDQLVEHMIVYSDDDAMQLLLNITGEQYFSGVLKDMGINLEGKGIGDNWVSVKDFSNFFRLLYNATYLNRDMSEKALGILVKSSFTNGIMGGVPKGILVANKFGERGFANSDIKQLHDCGIVYANGSPYLVCIMTRGKDFNHLSDVISDVSGIIYTCVTDKH